MDIIEIDSTALNAKAEQMIMEKLGDCQASVSVQATVEDGVSRLEASVVSPDGTHTARTVKTGGVNDFDAVVEAAISELSFQGAFSILN